MSELEKQKILILQSIARSLERIASILEASQPELPGPNYKADINDYLEYDWHSLGVKIETTDSYGVATVIWRGRRYIRRSPENAYGAVIYFSRAIGKDDSGNNKYERLITFEKVKDINVRPISREVEGLLESGS